MRADAPPPSQDDSPSLPLYAAGLLVTLCGVLTVTSELDPTGLSRVAILLTLLGFAFSLACRRLRVPSLWVHLGGLALVVFLAFSVFTDSLNAGWVLGGASTPDMRLAAVLMWAAILRSWTLVSDDLVLSCCVTTAATIGLIGTQTPNTEVLVYFCLFVLGMTFMLIHQNYLQFRARASARERARPAGLMLTAQLLLTLVSVLLVLSAGALLIVPAQAALANLSLSQALRGLGGGGAARDVPNGGGTDHFSDNDRLDIGRAAQWPTGSEVLLHVSPSDNQPHYWRGRTFNRYEGSSWRSTLGSAAPLPPHGDTASGQLYLIEPLMPGEGRTARPAFPRTPMAASIEVRGETDQFYYCEEARSLTYDGEPGVLPSRLVDGRIDMGGRRVRGTYSVTSLPPPDWSRPEVAQKLRADGTDYPDDVRRRYLPPSDTEAIRPGDLADYRAAVDDAVRALPPDRRAPFDRAVAIRDWIADRCTYSLAVSAPPADTDRVHEFLFGSKRGYCDLFASSLVLLCRVAHIPARVATGFAPGDRDKRGFNLRALDKHAWAEVYFPGDRWQVFDATVGTKTDGTIPTRRADAGGLWQRLRRMMGAGGPLPLTLVAVIVLLLLSVLKTEVYDRRRRPPKDASRVPAFAGARLGDQYARMTQQIGRLGLPRRPSETPAEFEARAVPFLSALEKSLGLPLMPAVLSEMTRRLVAVRYGGAAPSDASGFDSAFARWTKAAARARRAQFRRRVGRLGKP